MRLGGLSAINPIATDTAKSSRFFNRPHAPHCGTTLPSTHAAAARLQQRIRPSVSAPPGALLQLLLTLPSKIGNHFWYQITDQVLTLPSSPRLQCSPSLPLSSPRTPNPHGLPIPHSSARILDRCCVQDARWKGYHLLNLATTRPALQCPASITPGGTRLAVDLDSTGAAEEGVTPLLLLHGALHTQQRLYVTGLADSDSGLHCWESDSLSLISCHLQGVLRAKAPGVH